VADARQTGDDGRTLSLILEDAVTDSQDREERRAASARVSRYHEEQLRLLLDRVREGFAQMDAGTIDPFDLDELIHRYKRSAQKLWSFCGQTGRDRLFTARTLDYWQEQGEEPTDWWAAGETRRRP
jgi:hypothetical protein